MGMYTQVRGWLNVDSIAFGTARFEALENRLKQAVEDYKNRPIDVRKWVAEDTWIRIGSNGAVFIFIGSELKNYNADAETWIEHLLKYFPNAEGRVDFQYEEEDAGSSKSKCWQIYQGKISQMYCTTWCKGYGNMSEIRKENK